MDQPSLTIEVDLPELKKMGKQLLDALPSANSEEVEAGLKCFAIAYLGMLPPPEDMHPILKNNYHLEAQYLYHIITTECFPYITFK